MNQLKKQTARALALNCAALCATAVLLFAIEWLAASPQTALGQVPYLVAAVVMLALLSAGSAALFVSIKATGGGRLVPFYLGKKVVRLLLTLLLVVVFALIDSGRVLPASANLFALYLVNMVISVCFYAKVENETKQQKK